MSIDSATITSSRHGARTGALQAGLGLSCLTVDELRDACIGLGYRVSHAQLESALAGDYELTDTEYDVVTQAINDRLVETGLTAMIPQANEL